MVTAKNKGVVALTGNWSKGELEGKGRLVSAKEILLFAQKAIYQTLPFCSFFQKVFFDMDFI